MNVHVNEGLVRKLNELAAASGRAAEDIVEDALAGYLEEVAFLRTMLDRRYEDLKSGKVTPLDGEAFFAALHERENRLLNR